MSTELIPFEIEARRVIELLAKQIYQSPLALLRENTQNAFDAIKQRLADDDFQPRIDLQLSPNCIIISDNGIGMTSDDLKQHYWKAGSSSKNNETARAAGVVGTFGIGAMANFGIADFLSVETESSITGERTLCRAERARLSLKEDCIECESLTSKREPGTTITASIATDSHINVQQARDYIAEFVFLVDIPVYVNGELISQKSVEDVVARVPETWRYEQSTQKIGERLTADVFLILSNNADVWIKLTNIIWSDRSIVGSILLRSGQVSFRTFRSGFGLATASASSTYQFGGIADLLVLEPTAGREAINVEGIQLLQSMMVEIDNFTSIILAGRDECDASTPFMNWVIAHGRYDLCSRMKMSIHPGDKISLDEVSQRSQTSPMRLYEGSDPSIINMYVADDGALLVLARNNPRRRCETNYLSANAKTEVIPDSPVVRARRSGDHLTMSESGLAWRIENILEGDYFLKTKVNFGIISHGVSVLAEQQNGKVDIVLNSEGNSINLILQIYQTDFTSFASLVKDFVRTTIFPRIADYVPTSTRQGAEAFLKTIRRPRELFEYADEDLGNLPTIWADYNEGLITMEQAVERSRTAARSSIQVVDVVVPARDVVADIIENEQALQGSVADADIVLNHEASPAITRLEVVSLAKLLVIDDQEPALRGYRCFLSLTDKVREDMGEFFLQPHSTSIVWGGQKTLFIFLHHSGQFGLYYDLQTREPVDAPAGGGTYPTATIVLKDRIFIPIPSEICSSFVPNPGQRKQFEVRADLLRTEVS